MVTARTSGVRVEDVSQRTETTNIFANPDGTWTSETATEPVQVQETDGVWHDVDTTLTATGGGLAPRYAATDVVLSDGGDSKFASVTTDGGKELDWLWPTTLPQPVVEGDTATYEDVIGGGDLVVTAYATGFTHSVVLHEPPAGPLDIKMPVATHGADLVELPDGGVAVETSGGDTLVAAPQPLMWDSSKDSGGQPEVTEVATQVGSNGAGTPTLTLSPAEAFLSDPETVYPVTVDPSFTTYSNGDTWVQNADYTSSQGSSPELRAGTYDGGAHKARSFLHFDNGPWDDTQVTSATLEMRNFYSGSCTGAAIRAARLTQAWTNASVSWGVQPAFGTLFDADYSPARGYNASCDAGDAVWNVTGMVDEWAQGKFTNNGIGLKAVDETSNFTWRKYRSANYAVTTSFKPKLNVTYNSYPSTAGNASVTPLSDGYSLSLTPTLKSVVSDPDGGSVRAKFEVYLVSNGSLVWSKTSGYVNNGGTAAVTVPSGELTDGVSYSVKVKANDGSLDSKSWSTSNAFTVNTTYNPGAPPAPTSARLKTDTTIPLVSATVAGLTSASDVRMKAEVLSGSTVVATYFSDYVPSGEAAFLEMTGLTNGTYSVRTWTDNGQLSTTSTSAGTVTVGPGNGIEPALDPTWTPATQEVQAAPSGALLFAPSIPAGYSLELGTDGVVRVLNGASVQIGTFEAFAVDFNDLPVPVTIAVSESHLLVTLMPTEENAFPVRVGPVFEELS